MIRERFRRVRQWVLRGMVLSRRHFEVTSASTLIIAPHPDDESFGCGGLIRLKRLRGAEVVVVFVTRGEQSLVDTPPEQVATNRMADAHTVLSLLGVEQSVSMGLDDGAIPQVGEEGFEEGVAMLLEVITQYAPEEIYVTHPLDGWSDHTATATLVTEALRRYPKEPRCYYYWVWIWYSLPFRTFGALEWSHTQRLSLAGVASTKHAVLRHYLSHHTPSGTPYCGILPDGFLRAFAWEYEVFEEVKYAGV